MARKYPICDVFHWFCKIARFFATEPGKIIMEAADFNVQYMPFFIKIKHKNTKYIFYKKVA
jgi:hypothetical protein